MGDMIEVKVPDIGDYKDVPVIEILVKSGDSVRLEDPLVTLESDKATMDVPAPHPGTIKDIKVKIGDKVSEGVVVLMLETVSVGAVVKPTPQESVLAPPTALPPAAPPSLPAAKSTRVAVALEPMSASGGTAHASPSVRRFARELGVDLSKVGGSGPKQRILKEDVQTFVKNELAQRGGSVLPFNLVPQPPIDFAKFGPVKVEPLTRIKKLSAGHLHRNWLSIPHVTQHGEADVTDLEAYRKQQAEEVKKQDIRFTPLVFLLKASVLALKHYPQFNASLAPDGENLILKDYFHIGVAVDTPQGLVVPVVRDVDEKSLIDLAKELSTVSARMRDGKIHPSDLQGGCFSISSLGGIGGTTFTPIINAPEVAILGVSKSQMKPMWDGKQFVPRLMMPLSLSFDHRVIDGAQGARFLSYLGSTLSDFHQLTSL